MKKLLLLGAAFVLFGSASDVLAQRHRRGDDRIRRGVRSGQLTRDEARALRRDRRELRRDRREFRRELRRELRDDDRRDRRHYGWRNRNHRRGDGYYRRGAGSPSHPVFGNRNLPRRRN